VEPVVHKALPDGRRIAIRSIRSEDKTRLSGAFEHLSVTSRYRRFLTAQKELTPHDLRYLTEVDHRDHEALVALDPDTGDLVGVARYVRVPGRPEDAELAVTVVDAWQEDGVGGALVAELVPRARAAGIARFTALVLADNARMLRLLEDLGAPRLVERTAGTLELVLDLRGPAGG